MADEAIRALAKDGAVYQRAGALVRVVRSTEPPKLEGARFIRPAGVPIVRVMSHATLLERLSSCARWLKLNGKTKAWSQTLPSEPAARAAGARGEWGGVRPLLSVTSAPTMRADGSILQAPGYDADTGLLYWPNGTYHTVPDAPTLEDAQDAYRALCETVCDFPFARDEHKAAWVAAVLTLLGRSAIDGPVPMIAIDATTRGTGKSMLADAAFRRRGLGHGAARTSQPEDEDEFRKRITALAVEGDAAVLIDNINRQIGGASIEAALTGGMWKDRVLGITGMVTVPMLIVWFATGNNLEFSSGRGAQNASTFRLESPLENPEEREDFKHANLMRWIDEWKRGHLVTWALTILRAWHVAGRPKLCKVWGSFEAWSAVVPNAVKWVSGLDPMAVRAAADESMDGDKTGIRALADCIELPDAKRDRSRPSN